MRKLLLTIASCLAAAAAASAGLTATSAFLSAPREVCPLINFTKRIEMVQYFDAGMADKADPNIFGGKVEILSSSDNAITLRHAAGATMTLALLPTANGDTAFMVLENLSTPALDANVRVYDREWRPMAEAYSEPTLADWAAKSREAEVAETVPFMLASGIWNDADRCITLTPTINQWLGEDSAKVSGGLIRSNVKLKWNGRKFVIKK